MTVYLPSAIGFCVRTRRRDGTGVEIFLTGGTGYLGARLAQTLVARGHRLRALYRSPERAPRAGASVLPVRGDLERPDALRDAIDGVDAIVHTAAMVQSYVRDPDRMRRVNVDAVERVVQLGRELGVPRIVYTSSFMALGPSSSHPRTEDDPYARETFHNHYERTKYLGDQVARRLQSEGAPLTILYPTVIFGPGGLTQGNFVGKIVRDFVNRKLPGRLGRGDALWNYAFVTDVVDAHLLALEHAPPGSRYIIGGDNITLDGFIATLEEVSGVPAPTRRVPRAAAKVIAALMEAKCAVLGGQPDLTREVVDVYYRDWAFSSDRAMHDLGYRPRPFRDALSDTVDWARASGASA